MWANKYNAKSVFIGRGDHDSDLFDSITKFCQDNNIKTGIISVIGALKTLSVGYYNQSAQKYETVDLNGKGPFEILNCSGNVSIRDGKPFCHLHITVSDSQGNTFGGHVISGGCKIFAMEFSVIDCTGDEDLIREHDTTTNLFLWKQS